MEGEKEREEKAGMRKERRWRGKGEREEKAGKR